jgi:hypothetical protein
VELSPEALMAIEAVLLALLFSSLPMHELVEAVFSHIALQTDNLAFILTQFAHVRQQDIHIRSRPLLLVPRLPKECDVNHQPVNHLFTVQLSPGIFVPAGFPLSSVAKSLSALAPSFGRLVSRYLPAQQDIPQPTT